MSAVVNRVNFGLSAESLLAGAAGRDSVATRLSAAPARMRSWLLEKDRIFWLQKFVAPRRWPGATMEQDWNDCRRVRSQARPGSLTVHRPA